MKIPKEQAALLGAEALRKIAGAPLSDQKRFLLGECVRAYLPLDEAQKRELDGILVTERYAGVQAMNKKVYEEGIEIGIEKGVRETVREDLEEKFGPLTAKAQVRLQEMSLQELRDLRKAIRRA